LPESLALSRAATPGYLPDLRELRAFAAAARGGNLGQAARELAVTGSAISQQIRKLEDGLGTQLLIRHGRGVVATAAGLALLERADSILRLLGAPLAGADAVARPGTGIALVLPAELGPVLAAPLLAALGHAAPGVSLHLQESTAGLDLLCRGQADIAILPDAPTLDPLRLTPVATEQLGLVVAPRDALAADPAPLRLRALAATRLVLPGPSHWIRRLLARAAFKHGVRLADTLQVEGLATLQAMLRDGIGAAVLPRAAVQDALARGALVFRSLDPALAVSHAVAVAHDAPALVQAAAACVAEALRGLAAAGRWPGATAICPTALAEGPELSPAPAALPAADATRVVVAAALRRARPELVEGA
jgi:LysR family nitrogen assimilation transcriptional regulator